jgi:hypothetical protein
MMGDTGKGLARQLVRYDAMCRAIKRASNLAEVKEIRDQTIALKSYVRIAKDETAFRQVCELRIRAERRAGGLIAEMEKNRGGNPSSAKEGLPATLKELGISYNQSSLWQRLNRIPEDLFEKVLARLAKDGKPVDWYRKLFLRRTPRPTFMKITSPLGHRRTTWRDWRVVGVLEEGLLQELEVLTRGKGEKSWRADMGLLVFAEYPALQWLDFLETAILHVVALLEKWGPPVDIPDDLIEELRGCGRTIGKIADAVDAIKENDDSEPDDRTYS